MDRFDAMRVFLAVADEGGFAAAARRLRRSPPAAQHFTPSLVRPTAQRHAGQGTRLTKRAATKGHRHAYLPDPRPRYNQRI